MITIAEVSKETLIKREEISLKSIPEEKQAAATKLIQQAAFMAITLKELQKTVNDDGAVYLFENGKQTMLIEHLASLHGTN